MTDFLIKGAIIVFGFVPLGVAVAILSAGLIVGAMQTAREREREANE